MDPALGVAQQATIARAGTGHRFRLVSGPAQGRPRGTVVFVPAFAEEMNKARRMSARMARLLAGTGWRVVQRDLAGCGDSSGDFADASWSDWIEDVRAELESAQQDGSECWLHCTRAGALLAAPALEAFPRTHLLLWQPALSGTQHLQQFLRLQAGARIVGAAKSDMPSPLQQLRAGASVEIAGYELCAAVAEGMQQAVFDVPASFAGRIAWMELSQDETPTPSPAAQRKAAALRERGVAVSLECLAGPSFWQTQEIEECEALLERSLAAIDSRGHESTDGRR